MKELTYNKEFLVTIHKMKDILTNILVKKADGRVFIKMKTDKSIYVDLNTDASNFDFDGEALCFMEGVFDKFYKFFNCFKNPTISQSEKDLVIREGKNSIKFRVSDPDLINDDKLFNGMKKTPPSIIMVSLSKEQFSNIKSMIKMVESEDVKFKIMKDKIVVSVANDNTKNSYNFEIDLDKEPSEETEIEIKSTVFESAPELDYEVNITEVGIFHFKAVTEVFELNLYTGLKS